MRLPLPLAAVHAAGVLAFAAPFLRAAAPGSEQAARSGDAPWLLALLVPLVLAVAVAEASRGRMDARHVALLGVLAAVAALLRLPLSFAGANLMFAVPIAAGFVFGASFGFLLGALGMAASAAITGGIGPWLPFQMWAMGWVGMGAGLLRPLADRLAARRRMRALVLAAWGYAAAFFYGAVINLYFWPVTAFGRADISWRPGLGLREAAGNYLAFYALTSLAWDAVGALVNASVLLLAGGAATDLLLRYRRRFSFEAPDRAGASRPASTAARG